MYMGSFLLLANTVNDCLCREESTYAYIHKHTRINMRAHTCIHKHTYTSTLQLYTPQSFLHVLIHEIITWYNYSGRENYNGYNSHKKSTKCDS